MRKQVADAAYQRERRKKIADGELVPNKFGQKRRVGLSERLLSGQPWIEVFSTRTKANVFQRAASSLARQGFKVRSKTYLSVDPDTDTAVFIVEMRLEKHEEFQ